MVPGVFALAGIEEKGVVGVPAGGVECGCGLGRADGEPVVGYVVGVEEGVGCVEEGEEVGEEGLGGGWLVRRLLCG